MPYVVLALPFMLYSLTKQSHFWCRDMTLLAAEKLHQYRDQSDADPEKRPAYLKKQQEKWDEHRRRRKVKTVQASSERESLF